MKPFTGIELMMRGWGNAFSIAVLSANTVLFFYEVAVGTYGLWDFEGATLTDYLASLFSAFLVYFFTLSVMVILTLPVALGVSLFFSACHRRTAEALLYPVRYVGPISYRFGL